jgi:transglutaminase-like putative cysteine protease
MEEPPLAWWAGEGLTAESVSDQMRLEAGCEITFEVAAPAPLLLMLRPRSGSGQWVAQESYELTPRVPVREYVDVFGNLCQRLVAPPGRFVVTARTGVETSRTIAVQPDAPYTLVQELPHEVLQFLLPSRYCQSDLLGDLARQITATAAPGYGQAEAIRAWIHEQIEYRYGASHASTSAWDTARERVGVCRDFSHLGMALCRAMSIPARQVVGYLYGLKPMDLHAWYEAYVGWRWYTFDATQAAPQGGRIAVAYGRDAADVPLVTQFGGSTLTGLHVWVEDGK